jgi:hypothetical protein
MAQNRPFHLGVTSMAGVTPMDRQQRFRSSIRRLSSSNSLFRLANAVCASGQIRHRHGATPAKTASHGIRGGKYFRVRRMPVGTKNLAMSATTPAKTPSAKPPMVEAPMVEASSMEAPVKAAAEDTDEPTIVEAVRVAIRERIPVRIPIGVRVRCAIAVLPDRRRIPGSCGAYRVTARRHALKVCHLIRNDRPRRSSTRRDRCRFGRTARIPRRNRLPGSSVIRGRLRGFGVTRVGHRMLPANRIVLLECRRTLARPRLHHEPRTVRRFGSTGTQRQNDAQRHHCSGGNHRRHLSACSIGSPWTSAVIPARQEHAAQMSKM